MTPASDPDPSPNPEQVRDHRLPRDRLAAPARRGLLRRGGPHCDALPRAAGAPADRAVRGGGLRRLQGAWGRVRVRVGARVRVRRRPRSSPRRCSTAPNPIPIPDPIPNPNRIPIPKPTLSKELLYRVTRRVGLKMGSNPNPNANPNPTLTLTLALPLTRWASRWARV